MSVANRTDGDIPYGVGVLIAKDGGFLCGARQDNGLVSGPGGYIKKGETPEDAARRETQEEFGITPKSMTRIGALQNGQDLYKPTVVFLCTDYDGDPECDGIEMVSPAFINPDLIKGAKIAMYPAFEDSLELLAKSLPAYGINPDAPIEPVSGDLDINEIAEPDTDPEEAVGATPETPDDDTFRTGGNDNPDSEWGGVEPLQQ